MGPRALEGRHSATEQTFFLGEGGLAEMTDSFLTAMRDVGSDQVNTRPQCTAMVAAQGCLRDCVRKQLPSVGDGSVLRVAACAFIVM